MFSHDFHLWGQSAVNWITEWISALVSCNPPAACTRSSSAKKISLKFKANISYIQQDKIFTKQYHLKTSTWKRLPNGVAIFSSVLIFYNSQIHEDCRLLASHFFYKGKAIVFYNFTNWSIQESGCGYKYLIIIKKNDNTASHIVVYPIFIYKPIHSKSLSYL